MNFLRRHRNQPAEPAFPPPPGPPPGRDYAPPLGPPPGRFDEPPPPEWAPAPEKSHADGLHADATRSDFKHGLAFCARYPLESPRLLPSTSVERIKERGAGAWQLLKPSHPYFAGTIVTDNKSSLVGSSRVVTDRTCKDSCIMSDLPIVGGLYEYRGKRGVYFEVRVNKMDGTVAIGTTCKPYPEFRLPGWNRQSAALHLDDMRKFFEDPDGGRDYAPDISVHPGCVVGCGYDFASGVIFFTFNGQRLPDAFRGTYLPRDAYDVYAAIGFDGTNDVEVNFGTASFAWKEANEWAWRLEGHVGQAIGAAAAGTSAGFYPPVGEDLPAYSRSSRPSAR